jgi:hypothetical protein
VTTIAVNSTAGLLSALAKANGGDTIALAPGEYDNVSFKGLSFTSAVTITSQDPNNPAMLTSLYATGVNRINFSNLEFDMTDQNATAPFNVVYSKNISFDHMSVHGSMDGNPQDDTVGLAFSYDQNVSVTNSEFQQARVGITLQSNKHVTITDSSFHDIRTDGIHGTSNSYVKVANNYFTDFYPIGTPATGGDHTDAVQFWTEPGGDIAKGITVTGNTIVRGNGAATHGVFITDQTGVMPYQNVTINHNTITGEGYDALTVLGAHGVKIAGNIVAGYSDVLSQIRLTSVDTIALTNNKATNIVVDSSSVTNMISSGNSEISPVHPTVELSATSGQIYDGFHTMILTGIHDIVAQANSTRNTIIGNMANDTFIAGSAIDTFTGGSGSNTYVFPLGSAQDVITNFGQSGHAETIDLSAYLNAGLTPTVQDSTQGLTISFSTGTTIQLLGVHPTDLAATTTGYAFA